MAEAAEGIRVVRNRLVGLQCVVAADDTDVAASVGADVVFLKRPGWRPFGIRRPHEHALLGRSIDGVEEVGEIDGDPFFFGFVGPAVLDGAASPAIVEMARRFPPTRLPAEPVWFAAGGISSQTVGSVVAAGARRAVVSTAIFSAADQFRETRAIADELKRAWDEDPGASDYGMAAFR